MGSPVGSNLAFTLCALASFFFGLFGFLFAYLFAYTHLGRCGASVGFGLYIIYVSAVVMADKFSNYVPEKDIGPKLYVLFGLMALLG